MEDVEGANRTAIESCNKVLNLLSQPLALQDQTLGKKLKKETGEAVGKFQRVASLLGRTMGHARARISKNLPMHKDTKVALLKEFESDRNEKVDRHALSFLSRNSNMDENIKHESSVTRSVVYSANPHHHYQLLLHQRMQQHQLMKYRFQQQQQAEMMFNKSNSRVSLNFEGSSCTPTLSSNRSFTSSLVMDGSVSNGTGGVLQYFGASHFLDHNLPLQRKKCNGRGENGSVKCGGSRCHCSKKSRKHRVKRSI